MTGYYSNFFLASAGASAAILGLLVVALSVVNADDANPATRELRTVLAGSAFVALVDIFGVSIASLTGGPAAIAAASLVLGLVGLVASQRLIPRARRAGNFARSSPTRMTNLAFAVFSVAAYTVQAGLASALLADAKSAGLERGLVVILLAMYASALGRAWVVAGITRRV